MILLKRALVLSLAVGLYGLPVVLSAKEKAPVPKVSELLKDANDFMSQAQTTYLDGKTQEAVDLYRKALAEIARVERENVDRAASAEFAPVRFRKALCETEIDRILLEDVRATARTVAVTDTRTLEAKRAERLRAAETNRAAEATVKLGSKRESGETSQEPAEAAPAPAPTEPEQAAAPTAPAPGGIGEELEWAKDMISVDRFDEAEKTLLAVLKAHPEHHDARFLMAVARVRQGNHTDAEVILDDLLADNPSDVPVLLLSAGCQMTNGRYAQAMDALDKAMKAAPQRPEGYRDMAWLLIEMNGKGSDESELYYRQSVKLGLPRDREIERRLGIKE